MLLLLFRSSLRTLTHVQQWENKALTTVDSAFEAKAKSISEASWSDKAKSTSNWTSKQKSIESGF